MAQPRDTETTPKDPDRQRDLDRDQMTTNRESENVQGRADEGDEDEIEEIEGEVEEEEGEAGEEPS